MFFDLLKTYNYTIIEPELEKIYETVITRRTL